MDPVAESLACVKADYECRDFIETETSWPSIPSDVYKTVIGHEDEYTSPTASEYILESDTCEAGQTIRLSIVSRNSRGERKSYGGDYWLARLTKRGQDQYSKF